MTNPEHPVLIFIPDGEFPLRENDDFVPYHPDYFGVSTELVADYRKLLDEYSKHPEIPPSIPLDREIELELKAIELWEKTSQELPTGTILHYQSWILQSVLTDRCSIVRLKRLLMATKKGEEITNSSNRIMDTTEREGVGSVGWGAGVLLRY